MRSCFILTARLPRAPGLSPCRIVTLLSGVKVVHHSASLELNFCHSPASRLGPAQAVLVNAGWLGKISYDWPGLGEAGS